MKLRLFQIDAFAKEIFSGNPAAVCPLEKWLPDATLQAIAAENNLAETAFFVPEKDGFSLRWFTPTQEVDLCGHATLASAHVLFREIGLPDETVTFHSKGGDLRVRRDGDRLTLDFPRWDVTEAPANPDLVKALGRDPESVWVTPRDYLVVFPNEQDIAALSPELERIRWLDREGVIVTARGKKVDFVSRYFAPQVGIPEDPVTGSAHCVLTPFWAKRLGKNSLEARQLSTRGGELSCELAGERVLISGRAIKYLEGYIDVPDRT
jgi:PhzF family phenazine biosynthesis protein